MGTRTRETTSNQNTHTAVGKKPPRCSLCKQPYTPMCDFMQGRCPHHPATIEIGLASKVICTRLSNLINFFKGKSK